MKIKVLGPGCKNCINLEKNTRAALAELGMEADVEKVTDYGEIALSGKVASAAEVADLLRAATK
jgi:hypothetical protein